MPPQVQVSETNVAESRIGAVLKARREQQRLTLRTVATRAGFSAKQLVSIDANISLRDFTFDDVW